MFNMDAHCAVSSDSVFTAYVHSCIVSHQGMPLSQLSIVAHSLIVSRILYALPAWGGFLSAELCNKINAFLVDLNVLVMLIV